MTYSLSNRMGLSDFWDSFFAPLTVNEGRNRGALSMKTDVQEFEKHYEMTVELPGLTKKDIDLKLKNGYLTITATKREEEKKGNYVYSERFFGEASRTYYVGDIEQKDVDARFENGLLIIRLPKEDVAKKEASFRIAIN